MGDNRASVKIDFSIYGQTFSCDFWINWNPEENGCDNRVSQWFEECLNIAQAKLMMKQAVEE